MNTNRKSVGNIVFIPLKPEKFEYLIRVGRNTEYFLRFEVVKIKQQQCHGDINNSICQLAITNSYSLCLSDW